MDGYINPIANGIAVSLLILYVALVPALIYQYRKYGTFRVRSNLVTASFVVYMITAFFMTLLPLPSIEAVKNAAPVPANFRPFLFVQTFLEQSGFVWNKTDTWFRALRSASFYTVAFNLLLTMPFGVYLRKYYNQSLIKVALLGFLLSLFYEATQFTGVWGIYPHAFRYADVDDLMINTLGAMLGYWAGGAIGRLLPDPGKDAAVYTEHAGLLRRLLALSIDSFLVGFLFDFLCVFAFILMGQRQAWMEVRLRFVSVGIVFILPAFASKKRRTVGMAVLALTLKDKTGERARGTSVALRGALIGFWSNLALFLSGQDAQMPFFIFGQVFLFAFYWGFLAVMLVLAIKNRQITYFWEKPLNAYVKAERGGAFKQKPRAKKQ